MINQINIDALGLSSEHFIVKDFYLDRDQNKYIAIIESKKKGYKMWMWIFKNYLTFISS